MSEKRFLTQVHFSHATQSARTLIDFPYQSRAGRIEFSRKDVSKIERHSLLRSTLVYDSSICPLRADEEIFSLPIENAFYRIYTKQNGLFNLSITVKEKLEISPLLIQKKLKPWFLAIGIHGTLILVSALYLSDYSWNQSVATEKIASPKPEALVDKAAVVLAPQQKNHFTDKVAFSGFSLWKILESKRPKTTREDQISSLLEQELSSDSTPIKVRQVVGQKNSGKASLINFKIGNQSVDVLKLANNSGLGSRGKVVTLSHAERTKAEAELKSIMDQAQKQMRNFYSEALRKDPSFNTRVVVTAMISEQGSLDKLQAIAQGHSSQQSQLAESLSSSIRSFLLTMSVPKVLAGHMIRREFIFWK